MSVDDAIKYLIYVSLDSLDYIDDGGTIIQCGEDVACEFYNSLVKTCGN